MAEEQTQTQTALRGVSFNLTSLAELNFTLPTGYSFSQWNATIDGAARTFNDGQEVTFTNDTDLYANWTPIPYPITYSMNYPSDYTQTGSEPELPFTEAWSTYTVEDQYRPGSPEIQISGYTFNGWDPNEILVGSTGPVTFIANWLQLNTTEYTISYQTYLSGTSAPESARTRYQPSEVGREGYTPGNCDTYSNKIKTSADYNGSSYYPDEEYRYREFICWSPDKIHYGRSGNFIFHANWRNIYDAYFVKNANGTETGINISGKNILVKLPVGNYTLTFDNQYFKVKHDGDQVHSVTIFLQVYAVQGNNTVYICSIPIPKSCVSTTSAADFSEESITTPCSSSTGVTNEYLKTKTIKCTVNGNTVSTRFTLTNIPITIPTPGDPIPANLLSNGGTYYYPKTSLNLANTADTIDYQVKFVCESSCGLFSTIIYHNSETGKEHVRAIRTDITLPTAHYIWYEDGTKNDDTLENHRDTGIVNGCHFHEHMTNAYGKKAKVLFVGDIVNTIGYDNSYGTNQSDGVNWGYFEEVVLSPTVTTIAAQAFENSNLINMVIPETVTSIGSNVFNGCSQLKMLAFECPYSTLENVNGLLTGCGSVETLHLNCTKAEYQAKASTWWNGTTPNANIQIICTDYAFDKNWNNLNIP